MKKWGLILAALSLGTAPMLSDERIGAKTRSEKISSEAKEEVLGKNAVNEIRSNYESGVYDGFLEEMDKSYQGALEKGEIKLLGSLRPGEVPELAKWAKEMDKLQEEKQQALFSLAGSQNQGTNSFLEKVVAASAGSETENGKKASEKMLQLHKMAPQSGTSAEENLLIEIDLEYEYKAMQLYKLEGSSLENRTKQIVLKMDKLKAIQAALPQFQDEELKEMVVTYAEAFDARLAQAWDMADLRALVNGEKQPTNFFEEQVASILSACQDKQSDLAKEILQQVDQK